MAEKGLSGDEVGNETGKASSSSSFSNLNSGWPISGSTSTIGGMK